MNILFPCIFLLSTLLLCLHSPDTFLSQLLQGGERAVSTLLQLFIIYAVWMGLSRVAQDSKLSSALSRGLHPICSRLFRTHNQSVIEPLAMNLSCNLLGLGGAATPYAVNCIRAMEEEGNNFGQLLLFIVNATSIQLVPTTVIALRASLGSMTPSDLFLPSLICTLISTFVGVLLFWLGDLLWHF